MTWLFRLFLLVGILVVVGLFSALLAPYFVDWKKFTADFETQASRLIGQPVKVEGKPNLRILPLPHISFEDVSVGENADGTPLMAAEQFSLYAELFPFLSREIRIVEMSVMKPRLNLRVSENGTIAWTNPTEQFVDPALVNIEKLTVEDGTIHIDGLSNQRSLLLEDIDTELVARTILGPWQMSGEATIEGQRTALSISTGSYQQQDQSMRVRVSAVRDDQPYRMVLDGPVMLQDEVLEWRGELAISPLAEHEVLAMVNPSDPLPINVTGDFIASPQLLQIPEYRLEVGDTSDPYVVTGEGDVQFREEVFFRAKADGRQIDLERIEGVSEKTIRLEDRLQTLKSILDRIPVVEANGEIDIALPAVVAGDTLIREIRSRVRPQGSGWALRSFQAIFPGNTIVEASGKLGVRDEFGFTGNVLVASRQPSGLAAWLSGGVDAQIRRLRNFGLTAELVLSEKQTTLDNLELRLDDAVLRGRLQRLAPSDDRPALIAEIGGNRINLDDLQALYSLTRTGGAPELASHDLNIRVVADRFESRVGDVEMTAENVNGNIQIERDTIDVQRVTIGNFYGARISSSGRLENVLERPNGNLKLNMKAENASGVLTFLSRFTGDHPLLNGLRADPSLTADTDLQIEIDTRAVDDGARGQVLLSGTAGGTEIRSRTGFEGRPADPERMLMDLDVNLSNASPGGLMRQLQIETLPETVTGPLPGPLQVKLAMKGKMAEQFATQVSANAPGATLAANGNVKFGTQNRVTGQMGVTVGAQDLVPYLIATGLELPGLNPAGTLPVSLAFDVAGEEQILKVENLEGQVDGNPVSGKIEYQFAGIQRPRLSGDLQLGRLSLPLVTDGVFGFGGGISALVEEDRQKRAFSKPLFTGFDARLALTADRFDTGIGLQATDMTGEVVMLDGTLDLNNVSFDALGTQINSSLSLQPVDGLVLAELGYNFANADIAQFLAQAGYPAIAEGKFGANGSAQGNGRSLDAILAGLGGNGIVTTRDLEITGMSPDAFDAILLLADADGFTVNSDAIREIASDTILDGAFKPQEIDIPYSISRGTGRIRNLRLKLDRTELTGKLEIDLPTRETTLETSLLFRPDRRDVIKGTDPVVKFVWKGEPSQMALAADTGLLEGYLSLRAFETSQRRVETLEARVIEKQRLQREIAYNFSRQQYDLRKAEEERLRLEAEAIERAEREAREAEERAAREEEARQRQTEESASQTGSQPAPSDPEDGIEIILPEPVTPQEAGNAGQGSITDQRSKVLDLPASSVDGLSVSGDVAGEVKVVPKIRKGVSPLPQNAPLAVE